MKKNLPITQKEIGYDDLDVLVTKTDTKGIITMANDAFCRVAGFSEDELVGRNHNIVRHPDMPEWAFKDLWTTVQNGLPWRGIVKNRAKNGDHYWVRATVSPIIHEGAIAGYLSLRKKPTRAEVAAAEALYKAHPDAPPAAKFSLTQKIHNMPLCRKIQLLVQIPLFILMSVVTFVLYEQFSEAIIEDATDKGAAVATQVIDSANLLMVTGAISDSENRHLMLKKIIEGQSLKSLRLERAEAVIAQFGAGSADEAVTDQKVAEVIAVSGKEKKPIPYSGIEFVDNKPMLRVITPYLASKNFHGTDCTTCHTVEEGAVMGVSDQLIDLTPGYERLHTSIYYLVAGQVLLQIMSFLLIAWGLKHFVLTPIKDVMAHLNEVVDGDFSRDVDISGRDEIGMLLCSTQSNKVLMGAIIDQIRVVSKNIDQHAQTLTAVVEDAGAVSQAQSEASHSMAAGIEEISVSIDHVAENADRVRQSSQNSSAVAESGGEAVKKVIMDVVEIRKEVLGATEVVQKLGARNSEIDAVVKTIKGLAEQTNLLALNAAIEAARAGEQGRGFAVVADEVRKLADRTARSTVTISDVVLGISQDTVEAINVIGHISSMAERSEEHAEVTGRVIDEISAGSETVLAGVSDISVAIREQSVAGRDIAVQVEKIAQMAEENSASMVRVDESAKTLEHLSDTLKGLTNKFKV